MKIAFIGTVEFSKHALKKLINLKADIVTVLTGKNPHNNSDYANLKPLCDKHNIECLEVDDINSDEAKKLLRDKSPDYTFCFGWSQLLDKELLKIPRSGTIGYHPSLLPQNRGRHPIVWALALGLKKTGSTFFFMEEGPDTGDILSQEEIEIDYADNAKSLYEKITAIALKQIERFLPALEPGTPQRIKQDDRKASSWRKRSKKEGQIDWQMPSLTIYNLVRALTRPYVGAHFVFKSEEIKVWEAKEAKNDSCKNDKYGKILKIYPDGTFIVKTGRDCIHVTEYEPRDVVFKEGEYLK